REIAPGGAGAQNPQDAIDDHSMVRSGPAGCGFLRGKQRLEPLPLRVGEFFAFHTSECTPPSRVCKHALALRAAVKTGKIAILSSILNFEETLSILESSPSLSVTVLQLILELTDGQKLIKPPELLLPDAIRGYAKGETLSSPCLVNPGIQSNIKALVTSTQRNMNKLLTVVRETQKQKEDFRTAMKTAQDQAAPYVRRIKGQQPHFSDYWAKCAPKLAESLAERAGVLNACKEQGI